MQEAKHKAAGWISRKFQGLKVLSEIKQWGQRDEGGRRTRTLVGKMYLGQLLMTLKCPRGTI